MNELRSGQYHYFGIPRFRARMYSEAAAATSVPFTYGSVSFWNGKRSNPNGALQQGMPAAVVGGVEQEAFLHRPVSAEHTHRWIVFVRHPDDLDLTFAISKVVFTLHSSFPDHIRGKRCVRRSGKGGAEPPSRRFPARARCPAFLCRRDGLG